MHKHWCMVCNRSYQDTCDNVYDYLACIPCVLEGQVSPASKASLAKHFAHVTTVYVDGVQLEPLPDGWW